MNETATQHKRSRPSQPSSGRRRQQSRPDVGVSLPPSAKQNLETIAEAEKKIRNRRSTIEQIGDAVTRFFGSLTFVLAHLAFLTAWFLINAGCTRLRIYDPYPFPFLCLLLAVEFILLTTFVLMNQKRLMRQAEHWSHLDLQLSMLTEQEVTKSLQMLRRLCRRLGIEDAADEESYDLAQPTAVEVFVDEVARSLNNDGPLDGSSDAADA